MTTKEVTVQRQWIGTCKPQTLLHRDVDTRSVTSLWTTEALITFSLFRNCEDSLVF